MRVLENGWLGHLHAGAPAAARRLVLRHLGPARFAGFDEPGRRAGRRSRCPVPGVGDFRVPALVVEGAGRLDRAGPAVRRPPDPRRQAGPARPAASTYVEADDEAETLEIDLARRADRPARHRRGRRCSASRRSSPARCALATAARRRSSSGCAMSGRPRPARRRLEPRDALSGTWARERHVYDRPLVPGRQSVGQPARRDRRTSTTRSSRCAAPTTTEDAGEASGLSLVYSGNFLAEAEVDRVRDHARCASASTRRLRVARSSRARRSPRPRRVLAWRGDGPRRPERGVPRPATASAWRAAPWRDRPRPIAAQQLGGRPTSTSTTSGWSGWRGQAKDLGVELFVLDDGWFGRRDEDNSLAGRLGRGPAQAPERPRDARPRRPCAGPRASALWIEPEMVNADSDLFRAHPEWAIGVPGRERTESRQQLVLDFSRARGRRPHRRRADRRVLASAPIDYIKWDMNRVHHRAVDRLAAGRPAGRVLPPLHPGRVRAVPSG